MCNEDMNRGIMDGQSRFMPKKIDFLRNPVSVFRMSINSVYLLGIAVLLIILVALLRFFEALFDFCHMVFCG